MNIAHKTRTWVGRAPMSFPLVGALCAMALARAALAACAADAAGMGKKFVLYGWDTGDASLETVLANADKFADTGLDGISLSIRGNRAGDPRLSQTRDFAFTDPPWTKEEFAGSVALLREITSKPGLRHSYLQVNWTPWTRLPWRWDVAERFPTYDAPASPDGWRRGFVVARVPHGVDTMSLSLGVKHKEDGETTLFRNVEIFRLVD